MSHDFFKKHLQKIPLMAIIRGIGPEKTVELARACWSLGITLVEVPLQNNESIEAFQAAALYSDKNKHILGAGTVRTPEDVAIAKDIGAQFLVSPSTNENTIQAAKQASIPLLPGVSTPTDIENARRLGCTVQKLFPAGLLGPKAIDAYAGPFPDVRFVAVGSISITEIPKYLSNGAVGVGLGSTLINPNNFFHLEEFVNQLRRAK